VLDSISSIYSLRRRSILILIYVLFAPSFGALAQGPVDCQNLLVVCADIPLLSLIRPLGPGADDFANTNNKAPNCDFTENNSVWLKVPIATSGTLEFTIGSGRVNDHNFAIYGPNVSCDNLGSAIRCSSTDPEAAGVPPITGLRSGETDVSEGPGVRGNGFLKPLDVNAGEEYIIFIDLVPRSNNSTTNWIRWSGSASLVAPPVANKPPNMERCDEDGDGIVVFDLNEQTALIKGGQVGTVVTYHQDLRDAQTGETPLDPNAFVLRYPVLTLDARITRPGSDCSSITSFDVIGKAAPAVASLTGATSVCPAVLGVPYWATGTKIDSYTWAVEGGTIASGQGTERITVDWGAANDNAVVKLVAFNSSGCSTDTLIHNVKVNKRLEPETPQGEAVVCYAQKNEVRYEVPFVPGSVYDWSVENGSFVGANEQNFVFIRWNDNITSGKVSFKEFNPTITDCEGFSDTLQVQIFNEILVVNEITEPACTGQSNGQISLTVSGGNGDKTIIWADGTTGNLLSGIAAGTYTYTVTDEMGCSVSEEIVVGQPGVLMIDAVNLINTLCHDTADGTAEVLVQGGTGAYTYRWNGPNTAEQTSVNRIENLGVGDYTVEVVDENGCTTSSGFVIGSPPPLEPDLDALVNLPICPGSSDGEIQVDAKGGTPDYQFFWELNTNQTGSTATNLSTGRYAVRIVDANGCEVTWELDVTEFVPRVNFPTAFSPNGDGENDEFGPVTACPLTEYSFRLFNSWGELVFYSKDQNIFWDGTLKGKKAPDGAYTYKVFYRVVVNNVIIEDNFEGIIRLFN